MTGWTLIGRSLRFHARSHLGAGLGAAIGSAALIGALLVGDSVRESLRTMATSRLGGIDFVINAQDRLFQASLPRRLCAMADPSSNCPAAAVLNLAGVVAKPDASARANRVNVMGVEREGWARLARWARQGPLSRSEVERENRERTDWLTGQAAFINESLANQLGVRAGEEIVLRVRKPSALGLDAAISPRNEGSVAMRLKVGAILTSERLGDFSLSAQQTPPANLFLPIEFLAEKVGVSNRANLLAAGKMLKGLPADRELPQLEELLERVWVPEDAGLVVRAIEPPAAPGGQSQAAVEVASARIFLEAQVAAAALTLRTNRLSDRPGFASDTEADVARCGFVTNGTRVLTYLVNLLTAADKSTPYSIVTATESPLVPADLRNNEIIVNEWLADDLKVKHGDRIDLSYFVVDSASRLIERTNSFIVREIVPVAGIYADRTLMPEFPGLAKAESTHEWDAGFPLVYPIRDKDEAYWKQYRGTPKAFVTLAAGQAMWANRFGALTAVRYQVPTNASAATYREAAYRNLLANLKPGEVGLQFEAVRERALRGAEQAQDFGQLFLGFSIFLVFAALLLMALLFQFGLEQRASEVGTLLALGFTPGKVRRLLLVEGALLALIGGGVGMLGGIGYARTMLWGLTTVWRGAVGTSALQFHMTAGTVLIGLCASTVVAVLTIWLTLRKQARRPARELLSGEIQGSSPTAGSRGGWIALGAGLAAAAVVVWGLAAGQHDNAGAFFGAGALLLVAGLALTAAWLARLARASRGAHFTLRGLGVRGCARRRKRSLATVALLASGVFVIVAIGVFRLDANRDATKRSSGTGGFGLIGEATLPLVKDLNTKAGREQFGLEDQELAGTSVVPLRVHQGDEASCLNLSRAEKPRLIGVKPELLAGRFSFSGAAKGMDRRAGWDLLKASSAEIPAIADANVIEWALGKELGDTIDYTDEFGRTFKLRLVGAIANSILQGSLIIDESEFVKRFPGESGYRMFLIDAPPGLVSRVSGTLSRALQDQGLELTPTVQRLNAFNAVQNTYLGTFQVLGGLGLLLGSAGLGIVVLRNVMERRGELGLLVAVGYRRPTLQRLVLSEHGALLGLDTAIGIAAAAIAVLPAVMAPSAELPFVSLGLTLGAVLLNGVGWTWVAVRQALRGNLLEALRNE